MKKVNNLPFFHLPVLGREVCEYLITDSGGVYLDGTLGGGGHAEMILQRLSAQGRYIGVDRDAQALAHARQRLASFSNVVFFRGVFSQVEDALAAAGADALDGVLLDLGVSSYQIDANERGFAFRPGLALDMRMDDQELLTAEAVLATYPEAELRRIFKEYGEERHAARIAQLIVRQREQRPFKTSDDLINVIDRATPRQHVVKSYARIFQALRIEVNQELQHLKRVLNASLGFLKPGGRLVVISYHSLEDRIVKHFLKEQENPCICPPEYPVCVCGKKPRMRRLKPFLIRPAEDEIENNPRARSAKMRVGEKI